MLDVILVGDEGAHRPRCDALLKRGEILERQRLHASGIRISTSEKVTDWTLISSVVTGNASSSNRAGSSNSPPKVVGVPTIPPVGVTTPVVVSRVQCDAACSTPDSFAMRIVPATGLVISRSCVRAPATYCLIRWNAPGEPSMAIG